MNPQTKGLRIASMIFGLMAIVQLCRAVVGAEVIVAGYHIPLWASVVASVFLGALSIWMWKLARTDTK